jgi:hypothetical protein
MPQYGQVPGPLLTTFGCIEQVKLPPAGGRGVTAALGAGAGAGASPAAWGAATGPPIFIPAMGMALMFIPDMAMPPQQEPPLVK